MADNCARCGRKVKSEENWLRAHLWASNAVFHWNCFISLLKAEGAASAEGATWKADGQEPANK
jgi:hypothetical protein